MANEYLFEKITDLKERFKSFFQHRKKIRALENYSGSERFTHRNMLTLVKRCLNDGFLDQEESNFLDHMLRKYELNYLDWAHKTKWLKREMAMRKAARPVVYQTYFNFDKKDVPIHIPVELLNTAINASKFTRI